MNLFYDKKTHSCTTIFSSELIKLTRDDIELWINDGGDGKTIKHGEYPFILIDSDEYFINKINKIESQQTARMLRQAALGDSDSIDMLQTIEDQIAELRLEL